MTAYVCRKCSRYTPQRMWCTRHGQHVDPWGDMCEEGKTQRAKEVEEFVQKLAGVEGER